MLCKSCHRAYDTSDDTKRKLRELNKGKKLAKWIVKGRYQPVYQLDMEGNIVNRFESIQEASKKTGIIDSSITACVLGHYKRTRNPNKSPSHYKWAYAPKEENFIKQLNEIR